MPDCWIGGVDRVDVFVGRGHDGDGAAAGGGARSSGRRCVARCSSKVPATTRPCVDVGVAARVGRRVAVAGMRRLPTRSVKRWMRCSSWMRPVAQSSWNSPPRPTAWSWWGSPTRASRQWWAVGERGQPSEGAGCRPCRLRRRSRSSRAGAGSWATGGRSVRCHSWSSLAIVSARHPGLAFEHTGGLGRRRDAEHIALVSP